MNIHRWRKLPRSDCSLIRVHTVCLYAKIGLKSLQEYSADNINRRHFQMQLSNFDVSFVALLLD